MRALIAAICGLFVCCLSGCCGRWGPEPTFYVNMPLDKAEARLRKHFPARTVNHEVERIARSLDLRPFAYEFVRDGEALKLRPDVPLTESVRPNDALVIMPAKGQEQIEGWTAVRSDRLEYVDQGFWICGGGAVIKVRQMLNRYTFIFDRDRLAQIRLEPVWPEDWIEERNTIVIEY